MCGRYASSRKPEDLIEEFEVDRVDVPAPLEPDYNVAPTKEVYAVFDRLPRSDRDGGSDDEPPQAQRRLATLTWGLVPSWAKDRAIGSRLINARLETLAEKPAFRRAYAKRRCLLPADGYFEWYATDQVGPRGKPIKQPFFIAPADGGVLAMAGLYEIWRNREVPEDHEDAFVWTATVITTSAQDDLGHIHDRMPMLVEQGGYDRWLDATVTDPATISDVLVPAAPGRLQAIPVSTEVNNVKNNGAQLIEPLPLVAGSGDEVAAAAVSPEGVQEQLFQP